jgi:hypothetical protein
MIDRWFPGKIHIKRVSGTDDAKTHKAILAMLDMLVRKGRLDLIRAIAEGVVHPLDVYDRYRTDKLDQLPSAETMRALWNVGERIGVAEEWRQKIKAPHRAKSVRYSWSGLQAMPQKVGASLDALPTLLELYRDACEASGTAQMFKNARNNVRAFLRDTVGMTHPLYLAVKEIEPLDVERESGHPFTAGSLTVFLAAMEAQHGPSYAAMARSLALSGMRPTEYWGEWLPVSDTVVRIRTAKQRKGKIKYRLVFTVEPLVRPSCARRTFEDKVREVTRAHKAYDLRRTFMHLMEQAKIQRTRRRLYLGHSVGDVGDRYEEHEVDEYLEHDRKALARYLAAHGVTRKATRRDPLPIGK